MNETRFYKLPGQDTIVAWDAIRAAEFTPAQPAHADLDADPQDFSFNPDKGEAEPPWIDDRPARLTIRTDAIEAYWPREDGVGAASFGTRYVLIGDDAVQAWETISRQAHV